MSECAWVPGVILASLTGFLLVVMGAITGAVLWEMNHDR